MPCCMHCHAESPAQHYARVVENTTALFGPWAGWRMAGRFLVAPGKAGRITPERMAGILWAEQHAHRQKKPATSAGLVATLPPRELFGGRA